MNVKRLTALFLCAVFLLGILPGWNLGVLAEEETVTRVITGSDFQPKDGTSTGTGRVKKILYAMQQDGIKKADGFLFCGDYDFSTHGVAEETKEGVTALANVMKSVVSRQNMVFVQGNHDTVPGTCGMNKSGDNDPQSGKYGVFVINQEDYMWYNNDEVRIKKTAQRLTDYLNQKLAEEYNKPIFVLSHLPLHYTMRTRLEGDAKYANYIFDVLNEAGKKGLNIVYLFGHDHSNGWDDYLGGSSIYLKKGDSIQIAQRSQTVFFKKTLNFTYMNAGYTGYYDNNNGADDTLTMCCIDIAEDGSMTVRRYSEKGIHQLKGEGKRNDYRDETGYKPNETVYTSPQVIAATTVKDKTPIEDIMELTVSGKTYIRIDDSSLIQDGEKYLIVYNGAIDKVMLPKVVEKTNDSGSRIGFDLMESFDFGESEAYGDYREYEWTFIKSENGWQLCYDGKYVKLTNTTNKKITATLEETGNVFTLKGEYTYNFVSGANSFNYNARDLINAYTSDPASFYIYKYAGYSVNIKGGELVPQGVAAMPGQTVTIKADNVAGYDFECWQVVAGNITLADKNQSQTTFVMPEEGVELKAIYKEAVEPITPDVSQTPDNEVTSTPEPENNNDTVLYIVIAVSAAVIVGCAIAIVKVLSSKKK